MSKITKTIREDLTGVDFIQNDAIVLSVELKDLPKEILTQLALHGISSKVGDSYAGVKEDADMVAKASAVKDRLVEGNWKAARTAASPRATQLAEALANVFGKTIEEATTAISALSAEQVKELRQNGQVKAELQAVAARKAAEKAEKSKAELTDADASDLGSLFG